MLRLLAISLLFVATGAIARSDYSVGIDPRACAASAAHEPAPDIAYQPGKDIDQDGRPIPGADLDPPLGAALLDHVEIALDGDTGQTLARQRAKAQGQAWQATPYLGFITFHDGHAYLDDIAVEGLGEDARARLCAGRRER